MESYNRHRMAIAFVVCLGSQVQRPGAALAGTAGGQIAAGCASCHLSANGVAGIPPIAGLDESRISGLLLAYRSGERGGQIMHVVAAALSPDEIAAVSHYLAGLPAKADR